MKSLCAYSLLTVALIAAPALHGASGYSVQPTVLGYVLDAEAGGLHRINGIPGASTVGDRIALDFPIAIAQVSPTQQFAIVRDGEGRTHLVDLTAAPPTVVELEGALGQVDRIAISPQGRYAVLHSSSDGSIQTVEGLPADPRVGRIVELPRTEGDWTAFAISDRGLVLAASAQADAGSLLAFGPGGVPTRVGGVQRVSDLVFLPGGNDAVAADSAASEILLLQSVDRRPRSIVLATERDDVRNPFHVAVTSDGRYVAAAVAGGVASIPLVGGPVAIVKCDCSPTELAPLAGGSAFRLTGDIRSAMKIVQVGAEERVRFIPALPQPDLPVAK